MKKRKYSLALSLAGIGAISAFASVSAASLQSGTPADVRDQVHSAIKNAFATDDYQSYLTTIKDHPSHMPTLTETQFHVMIQANKLREKGDQAGAKKLLLDAGIKPPMHDRKDMHGDRGGKMKMTNLTDAQKTTLTEAQALLKAGKKDEAKTLLDNAGIKMPMHRVKGDSKLKSIKNWFKKSQVTPAITNQ